LGDEFTRVRSQAFWLGVIALALAAIAGGYFSGRATGPPPPMRAQTHVAPSVHPVLRDPSDSYVDDLFSADDVVVDRARTVSTRWLEPQLAIVVGLCGRSAASDAAFIELGVPLAVDLDPSAPQASDVAALAHESGDAVLLHLESAPTQAQLARLRKRFGDFSGVASRSIDGFVQSLDGTGLLFFDERGDADPEEFTRVGIPIAQRDATVDDRTARTYIRFMLDRSVQRSRREGSMVVLMRPLAHSVDALKALLATRSVQFVALTQR
jgi:polysaccharide deacetylase 2 family uncharacterized protein YibQ